MFGISRLGLTFESSGPWAVFYLVLAGAVLGAVIFFYRRQAANVARPYLILLAILRLAAVFLVVLMLFRPVLSFERRTRERPVLLLALDQSRSMSIADVEHRPNRLQEARNFLLQGGGWRSLAEDFELRAMVFAGEAKAVETPEALSELRADGEATCIAEAVEAAVRELGERKPERVLLITDGQDNSGRDPEAPLQALAAPVDCLGAGTALMGENRYTDLQLTDVQTKPTAAADELAEASAFVEGWGYEGQSCNVSLYDLGLVSGAAGGEPDQPRELARQRLVLDGRRGSQEVKLSFTPKAPQDLGLRRLRVKVEPKPGEKIQENNEAEVLLSVIEPQLKVLYLDVVREEYKWLRREYARDPHIRMLALVKTQAAVFIQAGEAAGLKLDRIPETPEVFGRFDVVVVGNLDAAHFSPPARAALRQWVESGKGVLWLAGEQAFGPGGYAESELAPLIPARMSGKSDAVLRDQRFQMRLTAEGARHPALTGCGKFFAAEGELVQEQFRLTFLNRTLGPVPGASALAIHPEARTPEGHPLPVFVVGQAGRGKTAAFLAQSTGAWLKLTLGSGGQTPYHKFWGQTLRWLAGEEARFGGQAETLQAHLGRAQYRPGEQVALYARALDASGQLSSAAAVEAAVQGPGGKNFTVTLSPLHDESGSYQARWPAGAPGTYKLLVSGRLDRQDLGKKELTFAVGKPNQEFYPLDLNEALLRRIAERTGGRYMPLCDARNLVRDLKSGQRTRRTLHELPLFNLPLFFLLFAGLVTAEWVLRKRNEML